MQNASIISENLAYWTGRAAGYSKVNQAELATSQKENGAVASAPKSYAASRTPRRKSSVFSRSAPVRAFSPFFSVKQVMTSRPST